jgi:hypothetical protein
MNNHAERDQLKVDAVSLPVSDRQNTDYIVIYNVNIPIHYFNDDTSASNVLERVRDLLSTDFVYSRVGYQITASYELVHRITGQLRTWTGSFSVRNNAPAQISGFEEFDANTFVQTSLEHIEDVEERLTRPNAEASNWMLHQIISIIFNIQSKVSNDSPVLTSFPRHGRRSHRTFALP